MWINFNKNFFNDLKFHKQFFFSLTFLISTKAYSLKSILHHAFMLILATSRKLLAEFCFAWRVRRRQIQLADSPSWFPPGTFCSTQHSCYFVVTSFVSSAPSWHRLERLSELAVQLSVSLTSLVVSWAENLQSTEPWMRFELACDLHYWYASSRSWCRTLRCWVQSPSFFGTFERAQISDLSSVLWTVQWLSRQSFEAKTRWNWEYFFAQ